MDTKIFNENEVETKCKWCDWVGIPIKTQVGEFVTYICPNNHVISFIKPVVEKQKSIKKNNIKKTAVKDIITKMDFIVGRNNDVPVIELNKIYNENNLITFSRIENDFLDLIVTSPPYDNLREYEKNVEWDYQKVMIESLRTLKDGGVMVWVVGDSVNENSESGNSFRHAIFATDIGFLLHDTMIYRKQAPAYPAGDNSNRYSQIFEFMFVFSKGVPKTTNLLKDKLNSCVGTKLKKTFIQEFGIRENIWTYHNGTTNKQRDKLAEQHPAIFPEQLAADHIKTWSNEGDIIYDPFAGSGTTLKAAKSLSRRFIGSEISDKYIKIIKERLNTLEL